MDRDEIPADWAPNSNSGAGPAARTLGMLTGLALVGLALAELMYRDSFGSPEGFATLVTDLFLHLMAVVAFVLGLATAAVAGYHHHVERARWALVITVGALLTVAGIVTWWIV
ncbi:hypothetical protein ACFFX1_04130 [Dactylosporangium sucinum]|uniref:Uncharacterized protein n=1 Tax=Dactylosporangium sucinum TaxID=1424081 RepID=A0A917WLU3_9ACTN|nr:hypothetical protein [Dactylosporangium sucinum]GGM15031.1 hypothetical protein GCM10007977_015190 [Dactylosporangium sucinum]